jgi:hypothetical protein
MKNLFKRIKSKDFWIKLFFPFIGIASLVWFLIRVIPKPSRAGYPCMRVAAPLASSFVMYVVSLIGSIAAFKYAKIKFKDTRYISGILALIVFLSLGTWFVLDSAEPAKAKMLADLPANQPIGKARGIFPGRVVWYWDPEATNENCNGTFNNDGVITAEDNVYYAPKNNNETVIKEMLSETILTLTGTSDLATAWDTIFTYFNRTIRKETHGYQPGEKIFIKTNNQGVGLTFNMNADLTQREGTVWGSFPPDMGATSPYVILATLDQLVNDAGIPQNLIYVGDPMLNINKVYYEILSADFPDVHYMGRNSTNFWDQMKDCEKYGRTLSVPTENEVIFYSDRDIADPDVVEDKIYQQMYDADYMINIAALKGHIRAGITLFAKTHFGSHTRDGASHLHRGLVSPGDNGEGENQGYGKYRVLVDIMGHEHLGGKTTLFILDGLWGGDKHELYRPRKWDMAPFNGDYTSSIFASIDPVAISCVGHDFLRTEYSVAKYGEDAYPNFEGTDDHLQQAADSTKWPEDIVYDPENDGTPIKSLGTHEHWNNATDMHYTRNLGTGEGIDLYKMSNEPMLNYPVPDIIVAVNSPDSSIDLSNVFYAPIDDPATLSLFSQTNTSLITANIDGNELTLSFATDQIGTDTITVLASASETSVADQFIVKVIPNLVVNNSIPDITVIATAPNTTIDLSTVFYAIDGDTISYSIQNQTNPSLVTASIEGKTLTLDYNDALTGSDTITVLATIDGSSITDEFVVTVNPATAISTNSNAIPVYYSLSQNYPNPFNPETTIGYAIPANAQVVISIYDVNGRLITDILNAQKSAGYHTVKWNASNMSSGIYFYQIKADNFRQIKKCILIK